MDDTHDDNAALEALFEAGRARPPQVPDALIRRVLADAATMQPVRAREGWRGWVRLLGGAPGIGGLVTAACVGVWLGVAPPAVVPDVAGHLLGLTTQEAGDVGAPGGFGWDQEES